MLIPFVSAIVLVGEFQLLPGQIPAHPHIKSPSYAHYIVALDTSKTFQQETN
jgi:hypothetical protein